MRDSTSRGRDVASSHVYLLENLILESPESQSRLAGRLTSYRAKHERGVEMSEQILSSVKLIKYDRRGLAGDGTGIKITIHFKIQKNQTEIF